MDAKRQPTPAITHSDLTPQLSAEIEKWLKLLRGYGFRTDHDEVLYQLALVVQVLTHRVAPTQIDNLLGVCIQADICYNFPSYPRRKLELRRLSNLYAEYIEKKQEEQKRIRRRIREAREARTRKVRKAGQSKRVRRSAKAKHR